MEHFIENSNGIPVQKSTESHRKTACQQEMYDARLAYCSKFLNTPVEPVTRKSLVSLIRIMENTKIGLLTKMLFDTNW